MTGVAPSTHTQAILTPHTHICTNSTHTYIKLYTVQTIHTPDTYTYKLYTHIHIQTIYTHIHIQSIHTYIHMQTVQSHTHTNYTHTTHKLYTYKLTHHT